MKQIKDSVFELARRKYNEWYGSTDFQGGGSCLYWSQCAMNALLQFGFQPMLQAGSLDWEMVTPEQDDGKSPTHFSYTWSPYEPRSAQAIIAGKLPEMHVWVYLPKQRELVDFSTHELKKIATSSGLTWSAPDPPLYLWEKDLPSGVRYRPNMAAIGYALKMLNEGTAA